MPTAEFPKSWHAAIAETALPWRTEGGVQVLGETFPTAPRAPLPAPIPTGTPPDAAALATPHLPNPAQSPEQVLGEATHAALQGLAVAAPTALREQAKTAAQHVRSALPWLFGLGSRAEVTVVLENGTVGRIDRLVPHAGTLWIIDFKTGTPQHPVPGNYVAQLQRYAAAVRPSYPTTPLRLGLVWVNNATLVELPESA